MVLNLPLKSLRKGFKSLWRLLLFFVQIKIAEERYYLEIQNTNNNKFFQSQIFILF